jgi:hypothetical protein
MDNRGSSWLSTLWPRQRGCETRPYQMPSESDGDGFGGSQQWRLEWPATSTAYPIGAVRQEPAHQHLVAPCSESTSRTISLILIRRARSHSALFFLALDSPFNYAGALFQGATCPKPAFLRFSDCVIIFLHGSCFIRFGDPIFSKPGCTAAALSISDRTPSFLVLNLTFSTDTGKSA